MKLDMVGIIVDDIKESLAFYQILGFSVVGDENPNYVELDNSSIRISLNSKSMIGNIYGFQPNLSGERIELAFLCDSPHELNEYIQKIKDAGYPIFKEPWNASWGQYYAIVQDISGNYISLFCNELKTDSTILNKRIERLIAYGNSLKGAKVYYRESWGCQYFDLYGKNFGLLGNLKTGEDIITLKGNPDNNEKLRYMYDDIIPGYYSNKIHWNSILLNTKELTDEEIEKMILESYNLVKSGFSKTIQSEIDK